MTIEQRLARADRNFRFHAPTPLAGTRTGASYKLSNNAAQSAKPMR